MRQSGFIFKGILLSALAATLASCNPHEFPSGNGMAPAVTVNLHFNRDFPIYREISYPDVRSQHEVEMNYTLWGWNCSDGDDKISDREPDLTLNKTAGSTDEPDTQFKLDGIEPGAWKFLAWAHISDADTHEPLAYTINSHTSITLKTSEEGEFTTIPWNDAFRGETGVALCCSEQKEVTLEMSRPVGGFEFLTTDMEKFIESEITRTNPDKQADNQLNGPNRIIDLDNYTIGYHIQGYYPTEFDNVKNIPVDARTGLHGSGRIYNNGDGTGRLGGCMVLVNGHETMVRVVLRVYDKEEAIVTSSPIDIPVVRGKLTLVSGKFLTSDTGSGLGISPDFDDEYNYPVN